MKLRRFGQISDTTFTVFKLDEFGTFNSINKALGHFRDSEKGSVTIWFIAVSSVSLLSTIHPKILNMLSLFKIWYSG